MDHYQEVLGLSTSALGAQPSLGKDKQQGEKLERDPYPPQVHMEEEARSTHREPLRGRKQGIYGKLGSWQEQKQQTPEWGSLVDPGVG